LQHLALAFGNVIALAEATQLHLGLSGGDAIRGAHEVSVHVKQHNTAGAVKRVARAVEFYDITREDGR
jgi:hypothetical protein